MTQILYRAVGVSYLRSNLKNLLNEVYTKNEAYIITRPNEENVVIINEKVIHEMQREINNLNYLLKLAKAEREIIKGDVVEFKVD